MAYPFAAATACFAKLRTNIGSDRRDVEPGRHIGSQNRKSTNGGACVDVNERVLILGIARDDDGLRMMVLVVVANEDGDAVLVMMGMDRHLDIMGLALFDREGLRFEWEAGWNTRGNRGYLGWNLGKDRSSDDVDEPDGREEGGKGWRETHVGEEEMGVRCTREERRECYNGGLKGNDKERKMRKE